jgi:hypothetical protein
MPFLVRLNVRHNDLFVDIIADEAFRTKVRSFIDRQRTSFKAAHSRRPPQALH